ncbi:hypothetical protein THZB04_10060 [Vibrio owensii]|nr:hypothetical protein THZB04_10060 [Vibrio owensii]
MQIAVAKCKLMQNMLLHTLLLIPLSANQRLNKKDCQNEKAP